MQDRDFITWHEAERTRDKETLRQLILRERLPAFIEVEGFGYAWPDDGGCFPPSGRTVFAKWDFVGLEEGSEDEGAAYSLRGWFMLDATAVSSIFGYRPMLDQYLRPASEGDTPCVGFDVVCGRGFRYVGPEISMQSLWFRARDIEWLSQATRLEVPTPLVIDVGKPAKIRADREENLLRVIAGLWALSGLPAEHNTTADKLSALFAGWGWDKPAKGTIADTILKQAASIPGATVRKSD